MHKSRIFSGVCAVGLIGHFAAQAPAQLADYIWKPAQTGNQSWQVDTNWTAPTFPGDYPYTIPSPAFPNDPGRVDTDSNGATVDPTDGIVYPSVGANLSGALGANLNVDVGASNVTVASLKMGGTANPVSTTVSSTGGKLVFQNYEVNLTAAAFNPQVCAFGCGAAQITSGGVAGSTNTISAPIQIDGERLEFSAASTNNITVSGPITFLNYAAATNGQQFSSIRSFMPTGTKALITGSVSLVDSVLGTGATLTLNDPGSVPPSPPTTTTIQNNPATGILEISGVISDSTATTGTGSLTIGTTSANQALGTVILSGVNTYRGTTTLNRANLVLANNSALGVDTTPGDDRNGGASFAGNQNPSNQFGFNIMSDNDSRTISVDARISQWLTVTGLNSLTWAGVMTQANTRGIDNLLPAGKTFTLSGIVYGSSISATETEVANRIFTFDGTGTTVSTGGLRDKIKGGVSTPVDNGLGHFRKAGTGTVLISDPGSISDFAGDVFIDQGVMRFSNDANFDQARYVNSTGGAIGVDTGTFTNTTLLQKLSAMYSVQPSLSHGGLMLTAGEANANIDFTSGDLVNLPYMSVAAPQNGISYTGTITPSNDPASAKPTYRLGGGNATLTLPNNQLSGTRDVQVTNGGEVALNGTNTYDGVTRIQAKYHTTTQNQAIANTTTNVSNVVYEGTTLTVNKLLNGGVDSSIGRSSNLASSLVIQGSTLKYAGTGSNGTTNRLFTVGTGGATLDASGASGSAMNFTNAGALTMGLAAAQNATMVDTGTNVNDGITGGINTRTRVNVQNVDDIVVGMTLTGSGALSTPLTITATNNPTPTFQNHQVTVGTALIGVNFSGQITFGGVARTLTLAGSNTDNNTLSPLIADAAAATGTNTVNLAKSGTGKWVLTNANTYTGTTSVNAGTLLINGAQTGAGLTTVAAGATLGGIGTLGGALTNNGIVNPGDGVGTLSVNGATIMGADSHLAIGLSGANADKLAITGNLDLSATGNFLDVTGVGTGGSWVIATFTGALTGAFESITSGYSVTYGANQITLNAVTPPGVAGDYNNNGVVDAADYVLWRNGSPLQNEVATIGTNTPEDLTEWRARFGNTSGSGSGSNSAVPEPTSLLLFGLGLVVVLGRARRSS